MGKELWKFFIAANPEWMWAAKSGFLGEDAKDAEQEFEEEMGPVLAILVVILLVTGIIYGVLKLFNVV